jgi:putative transposase
VVWSFVYLALCRLLQLAVLLCKSERSKELEILLLRHELAILRRQPRRAPFRPVDRAMLAALARALPRGAWTGLSVRPATLLRWHNQLVRRRRTYPHGRPVSSGTEKCTTFRRRKVHHGCGFEVVCRRSGGVA